MFVLFVIFVDIEFPFGADVKVHVDPKFIFFPIGRRHVSMFMNNSNGRP